MGELAQFNDPNQDDAYYTERVWFGSQPEDGGLTQADLDELAWRLRDDPELAQHQAIDPRHLEYLAYLVDHNIVSEFPDGDHTLTPIKHRNVSRHINGMHYRVSEPYIELGPDDEPPSA